MWHKNPLNQGLGWGLCDLPRCLEFLSKDLCQQGLLLWWCQKQTCNFATSLVEGEARYATQGDEEDLQAQLPGNRLVKTLLRRWAGQGSEGKKKGGGEEVEHICEEWGGCDKDKWRKERLCPEMTTGNKWRGGEHLSVDDEQLRSTFAFNVTSPLLVHRKWHSSYVSQPGDYLYPDRQAGSGGWSVASHCPLPIQKSI